MSCPPDVRFKQENIILIGLWYHKSKPVHSTYLTPIARRFKKLYEEGLAVITPVELDSKGNVIPNSSPQKKVDQSCSSHWNYGQSSQGSGLNKAGHGAKDGCFCKEVGETVENSAGQKIHRCSPPSKRVKPSTQKLSTERWRCKPNEFKDLMASAFYLF